MHRKSKNHELNKITCKRIKEPAKIFQVSCMKNKKNATIAGVEFEKTEQVSKITKHYVCT